MSTLYLDCVAGLAGDMMLGLLLDLGLSLDELRDELAKLPLDNYELRVEKVIKQGIAATKLHVVVGGDPEAAHHAHAHVHGHDDEPAHGHDHHGAALHLAEIDALIAKSAIADGAKARAQAIFRLLGEAEAHVHGVAIEDVHFHEVGAVDSIVDIVGTAIGLELLGIDDVRASHIPVGHGTVHVAHGEMPIPAPATVQLLRGVPTFDPGIASELVTPTGAALLKALVQDFGTQPAMVVDRVGYGAGTRDLDPLPNVVRGLLGARATAAAPTERITVVETNVDDTPPEHLGYVLEELLDSGAVDVFFTPVQGKKSRPATAITVLLPEEALPAVQQILFTETTTFGMRIRREERVILDREMVDVETNWGTVGVKIGRRNGAVLTLAPEYEQCKAVAQAASQPLRAVYESARKAAQAHLGVDV